MLFALYVFYAVSPVGSFAHLAFQVNHRQSLATLLRVARTYVNAVAATQTVEYVYLHAEGHAVEYLSYGLQLSEVGTLLLLGVENKRTDGSVRTNVSTLVTLDTVLGIPSRNEGSYATFLILGSTLFPSTVFDTLEGRYRQQVAVLSVDGTNHFVDESGVVVGHLFVVGQVGPCGINGELLVFATAVNGSIVLVHYVFTLLTIRLHDELLHLLYSQVNGDNARDAEEGRLQDGVGAVAQTDFLCNLSSIDVVNGDVVLCEIFLHLVRQVLCQFFAFPDGVEQERTVLAQTAGYIVHVQVSLYVASYEVRCIYQVSGADRCVTETQVRTSETARLLGVVREVCLAVLVGIVTDNLHGVLVGTNCTIGTQTVELGLEHAFATYGDFGLLRQRSEGNVVYDTDSEVVLRSRQ